VAVGPRIVDWYRQDVLDSHTDAALARLAASTVREAGESPLGLLGTAITASELALEASDPTAKGPHSTKCRWHCLPCAELSKPFLRQRCNSLHEGEEKFSLRRFSATTACQMSPVGLDDLQE
jgi:hypothetical protein